MKRKLLALLLTVVMVCTVSAVLLVGCNKDKEPEVAQATSYVALDINPSVELILDQNNKVMSVRGLNEDANVMLYGEEGIIGADVNVAVDKIGKLSSQLGYINDGNNVININMTSSLETAAGQQLEADIKANITKGAGVEVVINTNGNFSLRREYEAFKAAHPEVKDIAQYRMIVEAMAADHALKVEEALKMSTAELIEFVSDAREDAIDAAIAILPEAEKKAMEIADATYEAILERAETAAYYMVASEDENFGYTDPYFSDHLNYIIYKNIAITLEDINERIETIRDAIEDKITPEQVDRLFNSLVNNEIITAEEAEAEKAKIVDENGNYPLEKVEAYIDIKLKNASDAARNAAETVLDDALDDIEKLLEKGEKDIPDEIKAEMDALPSEIAASITAQLGIKKPEIKATIDRIITGMLPGNLINMTIDKLEEKEDFADEQADVFEEKIKSSFTEAQLARVDEVKVELGTSSELAQAKAEFDAALKEAVAKGNEYLAAAKAERVQTA